MDILFVASRLPYPPTQGDRLRAYHQLRLLSRRHRITLITPVEEGERHNLSAVRGFCERIIPVPASRLRRLVSLGKAPFSRLPLQTLYWFQEGIARAARAETLERAYDVAHVQLVRLAPVASALNVRTKIIDLVDALSLNCARRAEREGPLLGRLLRLEARRLVHYERSLSRLYDRMVVCSPVDMRAVGASEALHVVPIGVDSSEFPYRQDLREWNVLVFTGRMGYFPNADGAVWFTKEVFPAIRRFLPSARLQIVGADPPPRVTELAAVPGVEVTGFVPKVSDYLHRATIAISPLLAGSGMQLKLLEAMACGAPVVASPRSMGGLDARDGRHLIVADGAAAFAEKIVRLLRDPGLRRWIARNARRLVEERYSWEQSVYALERLYHAAASQNHEPRAPERTSRSTRGISRWTDVEGTDAGKQIRVP